MLTILLILALLKMGIDQYKEDKLMKSIEDHEKHWFEEDNT